MGISKITSTGIYTGTNLLLHNTGTYNTFVGEGAGNTTMTGAYNSAVGNGSLYSNTTGYGNSAVGHGSLHSNTTGYGNSAVGALSLSKNITGNYNVAIGIEACNISYLDPYHGVYIGENAFSGVSTGTASARATVSNEIVIGANAIGNGSNTMTLGHTDITDTYLRGYIHNNQASYPTGNPQNLLVPVVASSFGSSSGYIKYANGLIIQWGIAQNTDSTKNILEIFYVNHGGINFSNSCIGSYSISYPTSGSTVSPSWCSQWGTTMVQVAISVSAQFNVQYIAIGF